ncbi:MAG: GNAT family N-acetyltransferase [Reyranellaceae bacterium]
MAELTIAAALERLADQPLRNLVLLKHLMAYPDHVVAHGVDGPEGSATLVLLDARASAYDRVAYPEARHVAFVTSDHPRLTSDLLDVLPRDGGIVFKLASDADRAVIGERFALVRRTAFVSFTGRAQPRRDPAVQLGDAPPAEALSLFEAQGHDPAWLLPLLRAGRAFACVLPGGGHGEVDAACFAFENFGSIWEIGGVVTVPERRGRGLASRVVGTALAELAARALAPRYQVEETNEASIRVARAVGLEPFLTLVHWAHRC